jgi:SRSO17 transposase
MVNDALHDRFEKYLGELAPRLGHADRVQGLQDYCRVLTLTLERKSIEPIAASIDPFNVQACHQSLHHLVARSGWSDREMLNGVAQQVLPYLLPPPRYDAFLDYR